MSRTLSKILVICALVVVIPLMVVGITLAAYYSIDNKIKVTTYVIDNMYAHNDQDLPDENGEEFFAGFSYAGKNHISKDINAGHSKTISISAEYNENAYKFEGWFKGTLAEYQTASTQGNAELVKENTLSVNMSEEGSYLAVYSVYKFNITYTYYENPESQSGSPKTETVNDVIYGSVLKDLSSTYSGQLYRFNPNGWKFESTEDRFIRATFNQEGGDVALSDPWQEASKVNLNYFVNKDKKVYTEEILKGKDHTLMSVEAINAIITDDIELDNGYTYFWEDAEGNKIAENKVNTDEAELNVYLNKEAIEYTATLEIPEWMTFSGNKEVNFTVESDYTQVFAEWVDSDKYTNTNGYTFWHIYSIFNYNGTDYKYNKNDDAAQTLGALITTVAAESPRETKSVALKIKEEKNFTKLTVEGTVTARATTDPDPDAAYFDLEIYKGNSKFNWSLSESYNTEELTLAQLLQYEDSSSFKGVEEGSRTQHNVELKSIKVVVNGSTKTIDINSDLLNKKLVDFVAELIKTVEINETETLTISSMVLTFVAVD